MLNVKQVASRLGVSLALVYRWCESRQLAHFRVGSAGRRGSIRIDEADLAVFVQSKRCEAAGADTPAAAPKRSKPTSPVLRHLKLNQTAPA